MCFSAWEDLPTGFHLQFQLFAQSWLLPLDLLSWKQRFLAVALAQHGVPKRATTCYCKGPGFLEDMTYGLCFFGGHDILLTHAKRQHPLLLQWLGLPSRMMNKHHNSTENPSMQLMQGFSKNTSENGAGTCWGSCHGPNDAGAPALWNPQQVPVTRRFVRVPQRVSHAAPNSHGEKGRRRGAEGAV